MKKSMGNLLIFFVASLSISLTGCGGGHLPGPPPSPSPAPSGPHIALAFTADIMQSAPKTGFGDGAGKLYYDATMQRYKTDLCFPFTMFHPNDTFCMSSLSKNLSVESKGLNNNMSVGTGSAAVCKPLPGPYEDMLDISALRSATLQGSKEIFGEPCDVWVATVTSTLVRSMVSACIASDGVPREFNVTSSVAYKAAQHRHIRLSNVTVGPPADKVFAPLDICENHYPMPPCEGGEVESLDLYRLRAAKEPNELADRNVGDALGDMAFFCQMEDSDQVVTHWNVSANTSYGQYSYCTYVNKQNKCSGGHPKLIGRESPEGIEGAHQGQCTKNFDVGSWFSVPGAGECKAGARVGDNGCTWMATPLRTVSASCILKDRGLKAQCALDRGHAPMSRSAEIFRKALASDDPSQGGCPDVVELDVQNVVV